MLFLEYLKRTGVKELPFLTLKENYYTAKIGAATFKVSTLDLYKKQFCLDGVVYSYADKKTFKEMLAWIESGAFLKKTTSYNIFINDAHAHPIAIIVVVGIIAAAMWGISKLFSSLESLENSKALMSAQDKIKNQKEQCEAALKDIKQGSTSPGVHKDIFKLMRKFDQEFIEDGGFAYFDQEAKFKSEEFKEHLYNNVKGDRNQVIADSCEEFAEDIVDGLIGGMLSNHRAQENAKALKKYGCEGDQYKEQVKKSDGTFVKAYVKHKLVGCFEDEVCMVHDELDSCLEEVWDEHNKMRTSGAKKQGSVPYYYDDETGLYGEDSIDGSANR